MKKIILLLFLLCIKINVLAVYFYYGDELVPNMYMVRDSGINSESSAVYLVKRVDNKEYAYCIEPLTLLNRDSNYTEYDQNQEFFNLPASILKKINIIAYYGYKYLNHEDNSWYGVTQYLIWKTIYPSYNFYFADRRFGNKVDWYDNMVLELENLVNRELEGFKLENRYELKTGLEYTIIDNDLLNEYEVVDTNGLDIKIDNNKLIVKSNKEGLFRIRLKHKNRRMNHYLLYDSIDAQDLFIDGYLDTHYDIILRFSNVKLTVYKEDNNHVDYTNLTVDGAIYNLYDINNNLVASEVVKDGKMTFNIPIGKYYLKELEPSYGYLIDSDIKEIDVIDNTSYTVYEDMIYKHVIIHKQMNDKLILQDECDAVFNLYSGNTLIDSYKTNKDGIIDLYIPYGNYRLVQEVGTDGYDLVDDVDIIVDNDDVLLINLINYKKEVKGEKVVLESYKVPDTKQDKSNNYYPLIVYILLLKYAFSKVNF